MSEGAGRCSHAARSQDRYRHHVIALSEVAEFAAALPEVEEGTRYGHRTWVVRGKGFAWERPFSKADIKRFGDEAPPSGPILALTADDLGEKEAILEAGLRGFFTIPHFDGYAAVLIDLSVATKRDVKRAIVDAWLCCAPDDLARAFIRRGRGRGQAPR